MASASKLARVLPTAFFTAPFLGLLIPRFTVVLLCLLALLIVVTALLERRTVKDRLGLHGPLLAFAALIVYFFANALWSADLSRALVKAADFAVFVLLGIASMRAVLTWPQSRIRTASIGFVLGVSAGLGFLLIEFVTGQALARALFNTFPFTRPDGLKLTGGHVARIAADVLNRNVAVLTLSLWPTLLCLISIEKAWRYWAAGVFAVLAVLVIAVSQHQTSQIAVVVSLAAFAVAWARPRLGLLLVLGCWLLAFLLVLPLSVAAFKSDLYHAEWLPYSARARVILWAYTAEHVRDAPILGIGINSTYALDETEAVKAKADAARPSGFAYDWWAGPHAHNEYLQSWYELGVVGVILLMIAGASVIATIDTLSAAGRPFMLAHFSAFAAMSASAWGMWQTWLLALVGLAAIFAALAVRASSSLVGDDGS
jgi:O-antigen ligase